PFDTALFRLAISIRIEVGAALALRLVFFDLERVFQQRGVRAHPCDLPGDFHPRLTAGDFEAVVGDLFGDVERRARGAYRRQRVTEISIQRLEPFRQSDDGFAFVVELDVAAVKVEDFGGFNGGMNEVLVFRVEGMIYFEILSLGDTKISL